MKKLVIPISILLNISLSAQDYFQQKVNYVINVSLDDKKHTLKGNIYIDYTNNAPDNLEFIWFHLWPNAYKDQSTALYKQKLENGSTSLYYATEQEKGWIDELDFEVNGKKVSWQYHPKHVDICKIILNKTLKPGQTIRIYTPFFVKIPDAKFSRLGHVGQSYMITQWYPKPAVYDKDGWHEMPYLDLGEFYSEFGNFDVSITLPKNYTIGATGDLQNIEEIKRLNKLAKITDTITKFSEDMSFPASEKTTKTLRYTQNNIHDFGWFADKRFHVLKGDVETPYTQNKVTIWTMFTNNEAKLWKNSIEYMHDALYYYSLWNGDYPYNHCTAVDGTISAGGGMEYPNVTVIGESGNKYALEEVIMHEVGHNWFYGMLGSNERTLPWMDEGINSHNELRYMRQKYPEFNMLTEELPDFITKMLSLDKYTQKQTAGELGYFMNCWIAKDQPIELHSADYTEMNYWSIVYSKTAVVFDYLMAYLGEDLYDQCMKEYFQRWKFKHPSPEDLRSVFEEITKEDLSWFFDDIIKTTKQLDYAITNIEKDAENLLITLRNKGDIKSPVVISGIKNGESISPLWINGFEGKKTITYPNKDYDHIRIDHNGDITETNRNNNIMRIKGLFRKTEPIKLQFLGSLYDPDKTQIFFHPKINYNIYNKHSFGIKFYNTVIPKNGFSYSIAPLYSSGTKDMKGEGNLKYSSYNHEGLIYKYTLSINTRKYLYDYEKEYTRINPTIDIQLQKPYLRSKLDHFIHASYIHLQKVDETLKFIKFKYTYSNANTLNPYSLHFGFETGGRGGSIASLLTSIPGSSSYFRGGNRNKYNKINLTFYNTRHLNDKKRLNIRGYLGFVNTNNLRYNIKMSAWNGSDDYMFSERVFSRGDENTHQLPYQQQILVREGGLKHFTNDSLNSTTWLSSLSLEYNFIKKNTLYAELGVNSKDIAYGGGIKIPLDINTNGLNFGLQIYLPIITESGIVDFNNYQNILRFNLYLKTSSFY